MRRELGDIARGLREREHEEMGEERTYELCTLDFHLVGLNCCFCLVVRVLDR